MLLARRADVNRAIGAVSFAIVFEHEIAAHLYVTVVFPLTTTVRFL